jgi:hypothetical protein
MSKTKKILLAFIIPFGFFIVLKLLANYLERQRNPNNYFCEQCESKLEIFVSYFILLSFLLVFFLPCFIYWREKKVKRIELDLTR